MIVEATQQAGTGPSGPGGFGSRDLLVRPAEPGDRTALEAMFQRCTPQTIYRRFHGQVKAFPAAYLAEALAGVPAHFAIVACDGPRVVALASCRLADTAATDRADTADTADTTGDGVAPGGSGAAELGILIEDSWQRRGLGRELLARLVAHGDSAGLPELHAQVLTEQGWIIGLLSPYGECASAFGPGVREVRLRRRFPAEHAFPAERRPPGGRT
jgi:GNAT superfamily N-acetyltransferase